MADEEKKERSSRVTRFGKERFPDEPVEYKPLVRKGGRKQGTADISQSRVPVKSSVSNPFEEKSKNIVRRTRKTEETVKEEEKILLQKANSNSSYETQETVSEVSDEFSWDDFENILSLSLSDRKSVSKEDNTDIVSQQEELFPKNESQEVIKYKDSAYMISNDDFESVTPFNRRKKAIACGVPPRFFYSMSKDGFLEGAITEESVKPALEAFYRKRVQDRIISANLTTREMDIVTEEIENIRNGHSNFFNTADFNPDMSPDELFKIVIDRVKLKIR